MSDEWKGNDVSDQANQFEAGSFDEPSRQNTGSIIETKVIHQGVLLCICSGGWLHYVMISKCTN